MGLYGPGASHTPGIMSGRKTVSVLGSFSLSSNTRTATERRGQVAVIHGQRRHYTESDSTQTHLTLLCSRPLFSPLEVF